ncbi:MAG: ABC transporter ATP-binding protein [Synergistaceae bacterium]|nr:ABC transporter ATP-binding protein [Synergistaceae bacterium]
MSEFLLEVKNLRTYFDIFRGTVKSVDGVDFTLKTGEILGIVGESGGGKSVTGFSILRLIDYPGRIAEGEVLFNGEDLVKKSEDEMRHIRGKEISMIFQDPMTSLNPLQTIGRQIDEMLCLHTSLSSSQRKKRMLDLLNEVGISNPEERLRSYPHQFSGGMRQRVVIAIALAANPRIIIADEPTTALDVTVQAQILTLMDNLVKKFGSALILITHDLAVVSEMTHRVAVMYCGKIVEEAPTKELIKDPYHPYTKGLMDSIPKMSGERTRHLPQILGMVPSLFDLPNGCYFAPRCSRATERCRNEIPQMKQVSSERRVACYNPVCKNNGG